MANDTMNTMQRVGEGLTPLEKFSNIPIRPTLQHLHHFGCPAYVLQADIQAGKKGRKWQDCSRIGVYISASPQHAQSVALILSLSTGLVSPQFHVSFDDLFETTTKEEAQYLLNHFGSRRLTLSTSKSSRKKKVRAQSHPAQQRNQSPCKLTYQMSKSKCATQSSQIQMKLRRMTPHMI